jgi:hypothetical protein
MRRAGRRPRYRPARPPLARVRARSCLGSSEQLVQLLGRHPEPLGSGCRHGPLSTQPCPAAAGRSRRWFGGWTSFGTSSPIPMRVPRVAALPKAGGAPALLHLPPKLASGTEQDADMMPERHRLGRIAAVLESIPVAGLTTRTRRTAVHPAAPLTAHGRRSAPAPGAGPCPAAWALVHGQGRVHGLVPRFSRYSPPGSPHPRSPARRH